MEQYAFDQVEASWLGLDIKEGLATGTSIVQADGTPDFVQTVTGRGKVIRTLDVDRSGTLTITVDQTSQLQQDLTRIHKEDLNPATRTQVGDFVVFDVQANQKITLQNAYIMTFADFSRGTEVATFEWVFMYEQPENTPATLAVNLVGN